MSFVLFCFFYKKPQNETKQILEPLTNTQFLLKFVSILVLYLYCKNCNIMCCMGTFKVKKGINPNSMHMNLVRFPFINN